MYVRSASSVFIALILVVVFASHFSVANAWDNASDTIPPPMGCGGDNMCPCMKKMDDKGQCTLPGMGVMGCTCTDPGSGVKGHCVAISLCHGDTGPAQSGQKGGGLGMDQLMSALKGIMDALKGGGGGGGGGGGVPPGGTPGSTGCSTFYQTSVPNNPDPCSYYVPPSVTPDPNLPGSNTCTTYTQTSVANDPNPCSFYVPSGLSDQPTTTPGASTTTVVVNAPPTFFSTVLNSIVGLSGAGGDIRVNDKGVTIYAGNADPNANTGVAGFFGSNSTSGDQPEGLVSRLCISRPWATSFLTFIISPTFFDGLCKLRGYHVGPLPPPSSPPVVKKVVSPPLPPPPVATTTPRAYVAPQADIWAAPLSVPIGTRTSIFWNSKGVKSCLITSPDGNFSETSLSGAASTVPITTMTVFTISCVAYDDSHVTNTVTVNLKI